MAARAHACVLLLATVHAIVPWDCESYGLPMQMLKGNNDDNYRLVELDIVADQYFPLCAHTRPDLSPRLACLAPVALTTGVEPLSSRCAPRARRACVSTRQSGRVWARVAVLGRVSESVLNPTRTDLFTSEPNKWMNGAAYNPVDGIAYADFQYSSGNPRVLCRFSHLSNSQECFCKAGNTEYYSATITSDGHYYLSNGGSRIYKLANVASVVATSPLSDCAFETILNSKAVNGRVDTTAWGITAAVATELWGYGPTGGDNTGKYRQRWDYDAAQDLLTNWDPDGQTFADMVEFDYANVKCAAASRPHGLWVMQPHTISPAARDKPELTLSRPTLAGTWWVRAPTMGVSCWYGSTPRGMAMGLRTAGFGSIGVATTTLGSSVGGALGIATATTFTFR